MREDVCVHNQTKLSLPPLLSTLLNMARLSVSFGGGDLGAWLVGTGDELMCYFLEIFVRSTKPRSRYMYCSTTVEGDGLYSSSLQRVAGKRLETGLILLLASSLLLHCCSILHKPPCCRLRRGPYYRFVLSVPTRVLLSHAVFFANLHGDDKFDGGNQTKTEPNRTFSTET